MVSAMSAFDADLRLNFSVCPGCLTDAPPNSILMIPPPPLPSFLQISPALMEISNNSYIFGPDEAADSVSNHIIPPCNPHCDWSNSPGVEYIELTRKGASLGLDDSWFLILVGSSVAVLLLGALLAFILLKCRDEQSRKSQMDGSGSRAPGKLRQNKPLPNLPMNSGHCCAQQSNPHVLWAAITHKGTPAHFAVPPKNSLGSEFMTQPVIGGIGYYGALNQRYPTPSTTNSKPDVPGTPDSQIYAEIPDIKGPEKLISFDNSAFEDYAYEDLPTESFPLSEVSPGLRHVQHHPYSSRESREMSQGTISRGGRPLVSPPTKIESPNLPPLNQMRNRNPLLV